MIEIFIFLIGISIGSFLNVVIYRLPEGKNIAFPASHCPKCKNKLKFYHNVPLFSWLFLGGKCAFCKEKISFIYPLVEILSGLIFLLCLYENQNLQNLFLALSFVSLLALSIIDLKYKAVPEGLLYFSLLFSIFTNDIIISLKFALIFAGAFCILRMLLGYFLKKEAMGEADIIIAGVIGAILGLKLGLVAIYLSAIIALPIFLIISKKGYELPYIPFLAAGLFVSYVFNDFLINLFDKIWMIN